MLSRILVLSFFVLCSAACSNGSGGDENDAGGEPDAKVLPECEGEADGTPCSGGRICLLETCRDSICGDGYVDALRGEECDDADAVDGNGCEGDCTFSCHTDEDCANDTVCDGLESCVDTGVGRVCQGGEAPICPSAGGACVDSYCHPETGCAWVEEVLCYEDADEDGISNPDVSAPVDANCFCPFEIEGQPVSYRRVHYYFEWDCNDARADVRPRGETHGVVPHCPGQLEPAVAAPCDVDGCIPFSCANGATPSFDFDCDGEATPQLTETNATCTQLLEGGCKGSGWQGGDVPSCGEEAAYVECEGAGCGPTVTTRVQSCR